MMDLSVGCEHPVRVAGMCAICGMAVDDDSTDAQETSSQLHDISGVRINSAEAARLDTESTTRLLSHRKLALIIDLDQTIIHATVDPTVGEWMKDTRNPNYKALQDVGRFRLGTDGKAILEEEEEGGGDAKAGVGKDDKAKQKSVHQQEGCWYYVKPRPGLQQFLAQLAERYEMYVYTMGTRSYAECVCKLVDPQGALFGARILSRDENGSLLQKSLKKLFPMDTSMVVIIDDRADVWKWSPNLLKVIPFDFFVGIGDINASFLPAASTVPTPTTEGDAASAKDEEGNKTPRGKEGEQAADSNGSSNDNDDEQEKKEREEGEKAAAVAEKSQRSTVDEQLGSRPLAKMQEALDVRTEETSDVAAVLRDDDSELQRLRGILDQVHMLWYQQWDKSPVQESKPATTSIISALKADVLSASTIVFSSVIPLQHQPESSDLWRLASEFGATCKTELDESVTHVVAAKLDTHKVLLGQRKKVPVVWPSWLHDSCSRWSRQPEEWYSLPRPTTAVAQASEAGGTSSESDQLLLSNDTDPPEEEDEDEQGFGEMNWDEANDEVDAVLDGLTDEETTDEAGYTTDGSVGRQRKRKESGNVSDAGGESGDEGQERVQGVMLSPLSKRRRIVEMRAGQSKLKNAVPVGDSPVTDSGEEVSRQGQEKGVKDDSGYVGPADADADDDDDDEGDDEGDFLQSLQDELELQLAGQEGEEEGTEGLASDDE